jgi:hypothetical protein
VRRADEGAIRRRPRLRSPILVPQLDRDVGDVAGLVAVERFLFAARRDRSALAAEQAF